VYTYLLLSRASRGLTGRASADGWTIRLTFIRAVFIIGKNNFIKRLDKEGVDGFVLFNRFFQPDIEIEEEKYICTVKV